MWKVCLSDSQPNKILWLLNGKHIFGEIYKFWVLIGRAGKFHMFVCLCLFVCVCVCESYGKKSVAVQYMI